jgi:multidrug transporter EmrE-like cation transporter
MSGRIADMGQVSAWLYVTTTVLLTVYGQLVVKWQVGQAGAFPAAFGDKLQFLFRLAVSPWMISVFLAAFVAALAWMAAMTRLELSRAYPFVGLSFVLVMIGSAIFFDESLTVSKVMGVLLIVLGLAIGSRL